MKKTFGITSSDWVGKTKLSVELAKTLNEEIINTDSMQIYKELNVWNEEISSESQTQIKKRGKYLEKNNRNNRSYWGRKN